MDLLPKVETEFIEETPEPLKEELESDDDNVEVVIEEAEPEPQLPEVEKKSSIPEEDIFVEKKTKKELTVEPVKPVKKKRVMTEAQLERLRIGREKGLAKRRAAAAEKKELKELKSKKKKKEIQQLRDEVGDKPKPAPAPAPAPALLKRSLSHLRISLKICCLNYKKQQSKDMIRSGGQENKRRRKKKANSRSKPTFAIWFRMLSNPHSPQDMGSPDSLIIYGESPKKSEVPKVPKYNLNNCDFAFVILLFSLFLIFIFYFIFFEDFEVFEDALYFMVYMFLMISYVL